MRRVRVPGVGQAQVIARRVCSPVPVIIGSVDPEEYVEAVLAVVEQIPRGRVCTYGAIAGHVGSGGPRKVGRVMSQFGGPVAWWRVVRSDGSLPPSHGDEAMARYLDEGTPLRQSGRVHMPAAFWQP